MSQIISLKRKININSLSPRRIIVSSFALIILIGSILLNLPFASNDGMSIGLINAVFTATSATCVTGLVIADTLTQWTLFGQIVILVLIQVGGLGLITLATFFSILLGRKISMKGKIIAQESISNYSFTQITGMMKRIVLITFAVELLGTIFLSFRFIPRFGIRGIYMSIFHSISSFCNAGFDLMGDYRSLTEFNGDPVVIYTTAILIIIGGLGFIVWQDLYDYHNLHRLYLHTKIVLIMSFSLIVFGAVFFIIQEYGNPETMGSLTFFEKINAAVFQSVTCRTAGFNTLPINELSEVSKMTSILLMFIGAAPGSTGGGIKVTTFGIIVIAIASNIKGNNETIILRRKVSPEVINKAISIASLSIVLIFMMTIIIIDVEKIDFVNVLYEVTSAFGTVGLSTGITPSLHNISKLLLVVTMFLGRVGPLTFAIAVAMKANKTSTNSVYPEGKIMVG
ncbi:MAG: Trk family potassium uptake protein [Peptostreptococcaceae bacterium]|nr:Trk family potassium uptake protein [Peptostreptococcaceae bacterium]